MACGARSGLKYKRNRIEGCSYWRLNGLWCPFGIDGRKETGNVCSSWAGVPGFCFGGIYHAIYSRQFPVQSQDSLARGVGWTGQVKCSDAPCGRHGVGVGIVDIPPFGLNGQCTLVGVMGLGLWISLGNGVGQSSGISLVHVIGLEIAFIACPDVL